MIKEEIEAATHQPSPRSKYLEFTVKLAIATVVISIGLTSIADSIITSITDVLDSRLANAYSRFDTKELTSKLRAELKDDKTQIRLKGLLITNPAVNYRVSEIEEKDGNLVAAIDEIYLALGLLELHGADRATKEKYAVRLRDLERKLGESKSSASKAAQKVGGL